MSRVITNQERLDEIFNRGVVAEILPSRRELMEKLRSGERLRIYFGIDPTADAIHLGHLQNYLFLEELRQLGHEAIILIGDFTARVGDPSDRPAARAALPADKAKENAARLVLQIQPLLDFSDKENPPRIVYNSEWLEPLRFAEVLSLVSQFTVQQMLERDMFEKRWREGVPIHLHEFLYPLMQGYDSVALTVDAELCGTDQIFNALAGRTLLKRLKNKDKFVIALNLLANPKTGELMSKSRGAGVFLSSPVNEMYGAIMAQPDEMIEPLLVNCTRIPLVEKEKFFAPGPRQAKARVAFEIVKKIYGEEAARAGEEEFNRTFREGGLPEAIPEVLFSSAEDLVAKLVERRIVSSKTEWRRLIKEGAVQTSAGEKISDPNFAPAEATVLKIGKRRFVKVVRK